jgi:3-oxoacyl-[acyl-carrier-protein] synthase-3
LHQEQDGDGYYCRQQPDDDSYFPHMNGQFVFAVVRFVEVINEGLEANNLKVSDIDMLIPQANLRISDSKEI